MKKVTKKKTAKKNTARRIYFYDFTVCLEAFSKDEAKKTLKELGLYHSRKTQLPESVEIQSNQLTDFGLAKLADTWGWRK